MHIKHAYKKHVITGTSRLNLEVTALCGNTIVLHTIVNENINRSLKNGYLGPFVVHSSNVTCKACMRTKSFALRVLQDTVL